LKPIFKFLSVLLLLSISCSDDPIEPTGDFDLQGRVLQKGVAVENAIVKLDDPEGIKTTTDRDGYFKLLNVPKGNYELTVSKNTVDGSFSERTTSIAVDSDLNLDNLILPKGIKVYEPNNVTDKSLELSWSPTDASDFREYKIYQHNTSGLDETTGTLIHVSTSINDTVFQVPDLNPLEEYFFRVYLMNDFGRLGGSNIINAKTENLQILKNGGLEILNSNTGYPEDWLVRVSFGNVLADSSEAVDGSYSICVRGTGGISQIITPSKLIQGSRYQFSCWIKHDALNTVSFMEEIAVGLQNKDYNNFWSIGLVTISDGAEASEWKEYTYEFTMPSITASNYELFFSVILPENTNTRVWVDKISLEKAE